MIMGIIYTVVGLMVLSILFLIGAVDELKKENKLIRDRVDKMQKDQQEFHKCILSKEDKT